jgi:AmmeMemoRadiSam system protein B
MRIVRQPAVAGRFYPERAPELVRILDDLLEDARRHTAPAVSTPKALIVPHAGYVYSGPTAARGYALLEPSRGAIERVVLLGPAHYVAFTGLALAEADAFATPLGEVRLDTGTAALLNGLPQVIDYGEAHAPEHSLEVQLPFIQRVLGDVEILPLVVGDATPEQVAEVLEACWGGPETLVLISSDLSHYLAYDVARERDAATVQHILDCDWPLADRSACGARGINGLLVVAPAHGLRPQLVDCRSSGDTAGDRARVVGYASVSFAQPSGMGTAEVR